MFFLRCAVGNRTVMPLKTVELGFYISPDMHILFALSKLP
jgi:hypothetical protein